MSYKPIQQEIEASWRPIDEYDAMDAKPEHAAFYFPRFLSGRRIFPERIKTDRDWSLIRTPTHWLPLSVPPKGHNDE